MEYSIQQIGDKHGLCRILNSHKEIVGYIEYIGGSYPWYAWTFGCNPLILKTGKTLVKEKKFRSLADALKKICKSE